MLTQVDVTKFASYQWGREDGLKEGLEQGIEKGIEQGLEKGIEKGKEQGILMERLRLARQLIGLLDDKTIAEKTGLPEEEVSKLKLY
jgi:flagellar biosynthesis/type III secretory pathway protein FliH